MRRWGFSMVLVGSIYSIQSLDELSTVYITPSAGKQYYVNIDAKIYEKLPTGQIIETPDFDFLAKKFQSQIAPTPSEVGEINSSEVFSDKGLYEKRVDFLMSLVNDRLIPENIKY